MDYTVRVSGGLIDGLDGLDDVQGVIARNTPPTCELPIGTLTGQVLAWANKQLRSAHACLTTFGNGDRVVFIGRLPMYVTAEAVARTMLREDGA